MQSGETVERPIEASFGILCFFLFTYFDDTMIVRRIRFHLASEC